MGKSNKDDISKFHEFDICPTDSTIYLGSCSSTSEDDESGVDFQMAERTIKNLHLLDKKNSAITLKMNNVGGDVYHGLAIYDAIRDCKNKVRIIVYGYVMSIGSLIFQAADERIMSPNARMMIHYGQALIGGHNRDIYKNVEELKKMDKIVNSIYLERILQKNPEYNLRRFENKITFDYYLNAEESIEMGLCDKIL